MVNYVESLPDDDPTLQSLADCPNLLYLTGCNGAHEKALHCGPRWKVIKPEECDEWFKDWASVALKDAADIGTEPDN
jgi:hypothetical protein